MGAGRALWDVAVGGVGRIPCAPLSLCHRSVLHWRRRHDWIHTPGPWRRGVGLRRIRRRRGLR
eukprot:16442486-Heterocapsa_arctica.AAC.1